jgi:hypothetical protein
MPPSSRDSVWKRTWDNILLRTFLYYVIVGAAIWIFWKVMPETWHTFLARSITELTGGGGQGRAGVPKTLDVDTAAAPTTVYESYLAISASLATVAAFLLALPVAWCYTLTRHKKGYQQALAQVIIVLPVVDAAIVVLVKNSLALAFSLAGIVAAVRFRNTLEDSKDAVYILVGAAIGLASGVQVPVAIVLSIAFNLVTVALWYTDFGREPSALEGALGKERLERTREQASHTQSFVAVVDDELLKAMSPAQLDALADRAWRRAKKLTKDMVPRQDDAPEFDHLLRVHTGEPETVRVIVETVLNAHLKHWRFGDIMHESPTQHVVEFPVHIGDYPRPAELIDAIEEAAAGRATLVELV